jgi:hypothetical protein
MTISPVIDARKLSLPPIFGAERPFTPFSRTKPRIWLSWAADFAQTTNTSAMGAFEIHVFGAGEPITAADALGPRLHAGGVRAGVRLGEPETPDPFAGGELGQILLALRLVAVRIDRVHDQRGLHAHHGPVAGIDPLHLPRHEAVRHIGGAGAAVVLRQGDAEEAERAHLVENGPVGLLLPVSLDDARQQLLLGEGRGRVADHALVVRELLVEEEGVVPLERGLAWRGRGRESSFGFAAGMASWRRLLSKRAHHSTANLTPCARGKGRP